MRPVYFPFTYISAPVAASLEGLFGPTIVYLPAPDTFLPPNMRHPSVGHIDSRIPCVEGGERLVQACREFRAWGTRHYGDGASLKKIFSQGFYSQDFTAQIRSDILKDGESTTVGADPLFVARLFLMMAHELDARQAELDQEMATAAVAERILFARMNGLDVPSEADVKPMKSYDPGAVMPDARLSAWSRLFFRDGLESCFFVTTSPAVMEQMQEQFSGLVPAARFENMPRNPGKDSRDSLARYIAAVCQSPDSDIKGIKAPPPASSEESPSSLRITVHVLPKTGPSEIFRTLAGGECPFAGVAPPNTVIVLCET